MTQALKVPEWFTSPVPNRFMYSALPAMAETGKLPAMALP